jgi:hypothetical protein
MNGSIARLRRIARHGQLFAAMPIMMLVVGSPGTPDPIGKRMGPGSRGGVLTIPAPAPTNAARVDSLLNGRTDSHTHRGRVLYAPGHVPHDTASATRPAHRMPCPIQRVVAQNASAHGPAI